MSGSFDLLDRQRAPRGVATLLKTPFKAENRLDEASYRRQVRHVIDAGTVLLIPGMIGSETYCLPPEDRERCIRISLEESNGRVPVCAAVCGIGVYDVARSAVEGYIRGEICNKTVMQWRGIFTDARRGRPQLSDDPPTLLPGEVPM